MRIRKNINSLTDEELSSLTKALNAAYEDLSDGYELLAGIHGLPSPTSCPHHTADYAFLPWHRQYILMFEELLRRSDPEVTLPYWDWTEDPADTHDGLPRAVQPQIVNSQNLNPLASAPMRWVPDFIEQFGDQLSQEVLQFIGDGFSLRTPEPSSSMHDPLSYNLRALVSAAYQAADLQTFSDLIEQPHDGLHGFVGHHMGSVSTAAFDPIFWLHHANVDRQWARWQLLNAEIEQHPFPNNSTVDLGDRRFGELLDIRALDYDYDDLEALRNQPPEAIQPQLSIAPPRPRLLLQQLRQPGMRSFKLRFFSGEVSPSAETPTQGNPDFLGEIFLFGSDIEDLHHGHHGHGHAQPMRPFIRQLILPAGSTLNSGEVKTVVVDSRGNQVPTEEIMPQAPEVVR